MKRLLMALVIMASTTMLIATEADAKRMGGGGSFGKQSQSFKRAAPPQSSPSANPGRQDANPAGAAGATGAAGAAAKPSMMRNILGGALLGLGLGALLSHLGIGGAFASMISTLLMVALVAFAAMFIFRMIRNKSAGNRGDMQPSFANNYSAKTQTPEIGSGIGANQPSALQSSAPMASGAAYSAANEAVNEVPADFDVPSFVRNAKGYFIRLQAAWDRADINDIREFTTPEMFAELKLQLQERGATANVTDVVSLEGEFYGVEKVGDEYIASIKFTGMIREADYAPTEPFTEAWNLSKPVHGDGGWVLAGIQQL